MSRRDKINKLKLSSWNLPEEVVKYYHKQGVKEMFPWQVYYSYVIIYANCII